MNRPGSYPPISSYEGVARDQLVHSSVVLRGLIFDERGDREALHEWANERGPRTREVARE